MVDTKTYNKLSSDEQDEFRKHSSVFIRAVQNSGMTDGISFAKIYQVQNSNNNWFIAPSGSNKPFAGITSTSEAVVKALLTDAAQNYGR